MTVLIRGAVVEFNTASECIRTVVTTVWLQNFTTERIRSANANVLIRGATVEDNTALECICTVAATYGSKILQLNDYEANEYG